MIMISAVLLTVVLTFVKVAVTTNDLSLHDPSPLTAHDASGYVDRNVTLRCQLKTGIHGRGWFVISWVKINYDGSRTPVVQLPVRQKIPEWSPEVPQALKSRIQPIITVQSNHVEFNLLITNVTCSDEGEYRCVAITPQGEIISVAELNVYAEPTKPGIRNKYIPKMEHGLITLDCRANAGLPPRTLLWYYKEPGAEYFSILDNQRDIIEETDGCLVISTRTADVIISVQSRGTYFRCGYKGFIEKPGLYDELLYGHEETAPQMGEVREEPNMTSSCEGQNCQNDDISQGSQSSRSHKGVASSQTCACKALYLFLFSCYVTYMLV